MLSIMKSQKDMGHPLAKNLRNGSWAMEYITKRLLREQNSVPLAKWFEVQFERIDKIPRYLAPKYFEGVVSLAHGVLKEKAV